LRWSDRVAASSIRTLYRRRGDSLASLACAVERLFSGISVGGAPGLEVIDASVQLTSAWLKESGASRRQKRHQGMAPPPSTRGHAKALSVAPAASSVGSRNQVPIRALRVRRHASHIDAGPRIAMSVVRLRALQRHTQKYRPEWSLRGCVAVTRRTAPLPAAREHRVVGVRAFHRPTATSTPRTPIPPPVPGECDPGFPPESVFLAGPTG